MRPVRVHDPQIARADIDLCLEPSPDDPRAVRRPRRVEVGEAVVRQLGRAVTVPVHRPDVVAGRRPGARSGEDDPRSGDATGRVGDRRHDRAAGRDDDPEQQCDDEGTTFHGQTSPSGRRLGTLVLLPRGNNHLGLPQPRSIRKGVPPNGTMAYHPWLAVPGSPAIESVDRALRILQELSRHGSGTSLDDLSSTLALPKSSLHRTLAALRHRGFATQREDGHYLLGPEPMRIAFDFYDRLDVRVWLRPTLERLRAQLNETIHLGVLDGADVVYVDKLEPTHPIALSSKVGGRNPAHCTGVGKALLAWTYPTDAALRAWAEHHAPLAQPTAKTIHEPDALGREMTKIRAEGFAKDMEESEPGVRC